MKIIQENQPALWLFVGPLGYPNGLNALTQARDSCEGCPFGKLTVPYSEVSNDPSEAYYACRLQQDIHVWGENPSCTVKMWQAKALEELGCLGIRIEKEGEEPKPPVDLTPAALTLRKEWETNKEELRLLGIEKYTTLREAEDKYESLLRRPKEDEEKLLARLLPKAVKVSIDRGTTPLDSYKREPRKHYYASITDKGLQLWWSDDRSQNKQAVTTVVTWNELAD